MKYVDIEAITREEKGKNKIKKMRAQNYIPAVLYGGELKIIKLSYKEVEKLYNMRHDNFLIHINIDKKDKKDAFLKAIQYDPVTNKIIHIDLIELIAGKTVHIKIPIELTGSPEGVKMGGVVEHFMWELNIECLPKDIPELITTDITNLQIGDSIHVSDLQIREGIRVLDKPDQVILTIGLPAGVGAEEEEAAEAAEGEVAEGEAVEGEAAEGEVAEGEEKKKGKEKTDGKEKKEEVKAPGKGEGKDKRDKKDKK
ncbi:MAG: 50S ribosomal protein L25 [Spirochaetes bacterium]|nr:50S ribosomal protein L25 [Spirochaetota bacterium]